LSDNDRIKKVPGEQNSRTEPFATKGILTVAWLRGVLAFGALAVPMGPAPAAPPRAGSPSLISDLSSVNTAGTLQAVLLAEAELGGAIPAAQPPTSPTTPVTNVSGPEIHFASQGYNFGRVDSGEPIKHTFEFTNTGKQVLELKDVKATCGCTTAGDWTHRVEPGQSGAIPVQLNTANLSGVVTKTITVTCNDPAHPTVTLQLKGTVWKAIEVMPPLAFLRVPDDAPTNGMAAVRIVSHLGAPLTLGAPQSDNPVFSASLETNRPGSEFRLIVRATAPLDSAAVTGKIRLKTSAPGTPEIIVPVLGNPIKTPVATSAVDGGVTNSAVPAH